MKQGFLLKIHIGLLSIQLNIWIEVPSAIHNSAMKVLIGPLKDIHHKWFVSDQDF